MSISCGVWGDTSRIGDVLKKSFLFSRDVHLVLLVSLVPIPIKMQPNVNLVPTVFGTLPYATNVRLVVLAPVRTEISSSLVLGDTTLWIRAK